MSIAHFRTAADRRKALATLPRSEWPDSPFALAKLVKDRKIDEKFVHRRLLKIGGMSRTRPPREASGRVPFTFKLGLPFLTSEDGPATLIKIAQAFPKGFRQPSKQAKKWHSTSLLERVCGVKSEFVRSTRGDKKAVADAETRELVKATQDVRNIARKYLTGTQRMLKANLPPLPKADTLGAIQERHALAHVVADKAAA